MEENQSSTKPEEVFGQITPEKKISDVLLQENGLVTDKESNTQEKTKKSGIFRKASELPVQLLRSRTDISISKIGSELPITLKPSKLKTPGIFASTQIKKEPLIVAVKSSAQRKLISRKKSKSNVELQSDKKETEADASNTSSRQSTPTTAPVTKLFSISKRGIKAATLPSKPIHRPGTLPPYLERNKIDALQLKIKREEKAFDDEKKNILKMEARLIENYKELVKQQETLKNSGVSDFIIAKLELPILGLTSGNGDVNEKTSSVDQLFQKDALELTNFNVLRYVEVEMKKMSQSYLKLCQDFVDANFTKDLKDADSEALDHFRKFLNNSSVKLTENIAQMKLEQETALSNCQRELKSMMLTNVHRGTSKSVQELIAKTEQQNAQEIQERNEQIELLKIKVLSTEQQNKILQKTTNDQEKTQKLTISNLEKELSKMTGKCNRQDILQRKYERKIAELETKMREPNLEAEQLSKELEANKKHLSDKAQQYNQLRTQFAEMFQQHQNSIAVIEDKLASEREKKENVEADLIQAKEMIEEIRNHPVDLRSTGAGELCCGDVLESSAASIEMESQQCIINQMKDEIQHLVQERQRLLDIPNITQDHQHVKRLEENLALYEQKAKLKNDVIYRLENKLFEMKNKLSYAGASMQAEIDRLTYVDQAKQSELDSLRSKLSQTEAEVQHKDETIRMNKRLLRIRNELIDLRNRKCSESDDSAAQSEVYCNLFSTLTDKQITVSKLQEVIKRLEDHHARSASDRTKQIELLKDMIAENTALRNGLSSNCKKITSSEETLKNNIDLSPILDREEDYNNDRRHKRRNATSILPK